MLQSPAAQSICETELTVLDIVSNNNGRDFSMPPLDVDMNEAKEHFDVNSQSVLAFAPIVIEALGVIVNHSSVVWNYSNAWGGIYGTSKAAVKQMFKVLRVELVIMSIIGAVDTPIFDTSHKGLVQMPSGSYYEPIRPIISEIREGIHDLLAWMGNCRFLVDDSLGNHVILSKAQLRSHTPNRILGVMRLQPALHHLPVFSSIMRVTVSR
ncbi:hypothetical protein PG994_007893 [Apiospora phragmitis]|uniref:Uncharacterized protein n=1 Tax=Apiospora phragmitis TaxID=2905665 RepID=A0ABR1URK1_9PEZI